ncbi:peptide deformylase [Catellatospora methionotrophica]|uniref:peptide deformylase n=1 Tax=Catellatospora methionotrophica TaxID=121620 RepID=UPI0033DEDD74
MTTYKSSQDWIAGIASEGVVTIGDPRLKAPTAAVEAIGEVETLLGEMVARLRALNGAGLAAPQIGASVKAVVVEVRKTDVFPDRPEHPLTQMVNPVILRQSEELVTDWEGCFSVPGLMGLVPRHQHIQVSYIDESGNAVTNDFHGYAARVVQHEVDHLAGVEFLNRMLSMDSITTVSNYLTHHRS